MADIAVNPVPVRPKEGLLFDAVLYPNRSLSRRGFRILMTAMAVICFGAGIVFWLVGAWPVFGFLGLDVLLIYLAFRASYRSGRLSETVQLSRERLRVARYSPNGKVQAWEFQPYWLRVDVEKPEEPDSRLTLSSHGRRLIIGAFLSPEERLEFAQALRDALRRCRCFPMPAQ